MERSECEKKADEIRLKYNPLNLSPFPYEIFEKEISELSINLFPFSGDKIKHLSGVIEYEVETEKFEISINTDRPLVRQFFTIAHELGHYFLHRDILKEDKIIVDVEFFDGNRAFFREDRAPDSKIEAEANFFAAALLMPHELVKRAWEDLKSVEECARVFNVSVSAMSIRLEYLKLL